MQTQPHKPNSTRGIPLLFSLIFVIVLAFSLTGCGLISVLTGKDELSDSEQTPEQPTLPIPITTPPSPPSTDTNAPSLMASGFVIDLPDTTYEQNLTVPGRVGTGTELYIDGKAIPINPDGTFSAELDLTPGENTIFIKLVSSGNAVYSTGRKVVYKLKPPLTLDDFPDPYVSESPTFVVKGNTGPNSIVEVNGSKGESDNNGDFMISITLQEGENVLNVSAINADGIKSNLQDSVTYAKPEKPHLLVVTSPADNGYVSSAKLSVTGVTDPNSLVEVYNNYFIADKEVQSLVFSGTVKNGNFSTNVTLSEGENQLIIRSLDTQGRTLEERRTVTYKKVAEPDDKSDDEDTEPPVIEFFQVTPIKVSRTANASQGTTNVLKITAKVTDNDSGVDRVIVEYYNPNMTDLIEIELDEEDRRDAPNRWTGERTFNNNDRTGEYTLNTIYVYDRDGNWKPYSASELKGKFTTDFTVQ